MDNQPPLPEKTRRPWSVRAVNWLLLAQTAVLLSLAIWQSITAYADLSLLPETAVFGSISSLFADAAALTAVTLLLLFTMLAFTRLWQQGWGYAMLVQGLILAFTLVQHFRRPELYTYPLMLFSIFMVIYLHHPDLQLTFQVRVAPPEEGDLAYEGSADE